MSRTPAKGKRRTPAAAERALSRTRPEAAGPKSAAITCRLQGPLLIHDVMGRAAQMRQALEAGARSFDLGGVSAIDTAGVQLLVALAQEAARRQQRISLRGCARVVMPAMRALGLGPELESLMSELA